MCKEGTSIGYALKEFLEDFAIIKGAHLRNLENCDPAEPPAEPLVTKLAGLFKIKRMTRREAALSRKTFERHYAFGQRP